MIKILRHIKVGDQEYVTWFGMEIKKKGNRPNIDIFYYTGDPSNELSMHQLIKANFQSKQEAMQFGIKYMRSLYQDMLKRDREIAQEQEQKEKQEKSDQSDL